MAFQQLVASNKTKLWWQHYFYRQGLRREINVAIRLQSMAIILRTQIVCIVVNLFDYELIIKCFLLFTSSVRIRTTQIYVISNWHECHGTWRIYGLTKTVKLLLQTLISAWIKNVSPNEYPIFFFYFGIILAMHFH